MNFLLSNNLFSKDKGPGFAMRRDNKNNEQKIIYIPVEYNEDDEDCKRPYIIEVPAEVFHDKNGKNILYVSRDSNELYSNWNRMYVIKIISKFVVYNT